MEPRGHYRKQPQFVRQRTPIAVTHRTALDVRRSIGYTIRHLLEVKVIPGLITKIEFEPRRSMIPPTLPSQPITGTLDPSRFLIDDQVIFFAILGHPSEPELARLAPVPVDIAPAYFHEGEDCASVEYVGAEIGGRVTHFICIGIPREDRTLTPAMIDELSSLSQPILRHGTKCFRDGDSLDLVHHTLRIAIGLVEDAMEFTAGAMLRDCELQETLRIPFRMKALEAYEQITQEVERRKAQCVADRDAALEHVSRQSDQEMEFATQTESDAGFEMLRQRRIAIQQESDDYVKNLDQFTLSIREELRGHVRRRKLTCDEQLKWVFRFFDPSVSGALATPLVRTALLQQPDLKNTAQVNETLLRLGKVPNVRSFAPSAIPYMGKASLCGRSA